MDQLILPDAEWRGRQGLARLAEVLGAGDGMSRFVGGAVRDSLLGTPVADIDIATRHEPETVLKLLHAAGIRAVPTGLAHGTITAVLEQGPVEVTTLRRDVSTDGRRATVAFTDDWREDAARRDFTMNALYADPLTGALFDYFGGLADLEARRVRFIGDPYRRIAEDHLRILRFFRFLARFGDTPEPEGLQACTDRANDLMALSRERIADELLKLLVAKNAVAVMWLMVERGILLPVLPEITLEGVERFDRAARYESAAGLSPDPIRRLAALLPCDPKTGDTVGARLKLSNLQRKRLITALDAAGTDDPRALAYRIGKTEALDRIFLWVESPQDAATASQLIRDWDVPRLPLTGGSIVARGVDAGPEVARIMRRVEDQWIAEGFPGEDRVTALADEAVAQALRSVRNA